MSRTRRRRLPPGVSRDDSDDELGVEDHPWTWIYKDDEPDPLQLSGSRKRPRPLEKRIIGARMGSFECRIGDTVLLKSGGSSNEAWVAIICEFVEEDADGNMAANFMWFSTEKEIRSRHKKRAECYWNELYITPSWDVNPLFSINGKAHVMSMSTFMTKHPSGKVPRSNPLHGKVFVCRLGCNTRTATFTDEFGWDDIYSGSEKDLHSLIEHIKTGTKATRMRQKPPTRKATKRRGASAGDSDEGDGDNYNEEDGEDEDEVEKQSLQTPKKLHKEKRTMLTPSNRKITLKKALQITPLAVRTLPQASTQHASPFQLARTQLHVATVPNSLPCREEEFSQVYSYLEAAITEASGACIYISGTPGTGKTATVREVVASLNIAVQNEELDDFIFVEINGMKIPDPHQSYSLLWEALRDQRVSPAQALDLLEREFNNPSPRRIPCVVLMDELDQLVTKNQSVMYNFFNWPGLRHSRLIVLAVANTMDLPERTLSNKISSRLGLTRLQFPGYNHEQLMKIIHSRLKDVPGNIVEPDAIQFASRKVAAVSGDARRALDICRRAVELAESVAQAEADTAPTSRKAQPEPPSRKARVTIATIKKAINEATTNSLQQYLRALPLASKLVLAAFLARVRRTGVAESTYGDVLDELQKAATNRNGIINILLPEVRDAGVSRLSATGRASMDLQEAGVLVLEAHRLDRPTKVRLGISGDEVRLAFRDDPEVNELRIVY